MLPKIFKEIESFDKKITYFLTKKNLEKKFKKKISKKKKIQKKCQKNSKKKSVRIFEKTKNDKKIKIFDQKITYFLTNNFPKNWKF